MKAEVKLLIAGSIGFIAYKIFGNRAPADKIGVTIQIFNAETGRPVSEQFSLFTRGLNAALSEGTAYYILATVTNSNMYETLSGNASGFVESRKKPITPLYIIGATGTFNYAPGETKIVRFDFTIPDGFAGGRGQFNINVTNPLGVALVTLAPTYFSIVNA